MLLFVLGLRLVAALYDFPEGGKGLDCFLRFDGGIQFRIVFLLVPRLGLCCFK